MVAQQQLDDRPPRRQHPRRVGLDLHPLAPPGTSRTAPVWPFLPPPPRTCGRRRWATAPPCGTASARDALAPQRRQDRLALAGFDGLAVDFDVHSYHHLPMTSVRRFITGCVKSRSQRRHRRASQRACSSEMHSSTSAKLFAACSTGRCGGSTRAAASPSSSPSVDRLDVDVGSFTFGQRLEQLAAHVAVDHAGRVLARRDRLDHRVRARSPRRRRRTRPAGSWRTTPRSTETPPLLVDLEPVQAARAPAAR